MTEVQIDVREIPRPRRHEHIFTSFQQLEVGQALLLVSDHEPERLLQDFEREIPGSYEWESLGVNDGDWQVRITKVTRTALPRLVGDTNAGRQDDHEALGGSVWQLTPAARDLDANVIELGAEDTIASHDGPELDVLIHVLSGTGTLGTETGEMSLAPGAIVWLPRRSRRRFEAGPEGLRYFSVHQRKPTLTISAAPPRHKNESN